MISKRGVAVKFLIYLVLALIAIIAAAIYYSKIAEINIESGESLRELIDNTISDQQ